MSKRNRKGKGKDKGRQSQRKEQRKARFTREDIKEGEELAVYTFTSAMVTGILAALMVNSVPPFNTGKIRFREVLELLEDVYHLEVSTEHLKDILEAMNELPFLKGTTVCRSADTVHEETDTRH